MTTAVADRPGPSGPPPGPGGAAPTPPRAGQFTGTARLVRFMARLDRVRLVLWIGGIAALVWLSTVSIDGLYPTAEDLRAAAAPMYDNAAVIALQGPTYGIETLGGMSVFNIGAFGYTVVGLMAMFLVGRHTRGDEEQGRTELVRAAAVGRNAPVAAALVVTAAGLAVLGVLIALAMLSVGLPFAGSVSYGAAMAGYGLVIAAVTAVAAQVSEHNRAVYGMTGAAIGATFVIRAVGDVGDGTLSWLSPMGWAQSMRPYAGERWWPLLLLVGASAALVAAAYALLGRRDLGGGLVAPRPGPATGSRWLAHPVGLAVRLHRGTLIGWSIGLALTGAAYGSIGEDVADLVGDSDAMADIITQAGGDITDSYFASALLMLGVIAAGYAVSSTLRMRSEETAGRVEPVLATRVSRLDWAASHLLMALAGAAVVLLAAGLGTGVTYAVIAGDADQVVRLTGAALAYAPALWVLVGVATALIGLAPRAVAAAWAAVAWSAVVGFLGQLLDLPQWARDLSPFEHVPDMPVSGVEWLPLAVLTLVAAALIAAGLAGFRRRDVGY